MDTQPAKTALKETQLPAVIADQAYLCEDLLKLVNELESRLATVAHVPEENPDKVPGDNPLVPLARRIDDNNTVLRVCNAGLRSLLNRLEV